MYPTYNDIAGFFSHNAQDQFGALEIKKSKMYMKHVLFYWNVVRYKQAKICELWHATLLVNYKQLQSEDYMQEHF